MIRIRSVAPLTFALLGFGTVSGAEVNRTVLAMGTSLRLRVEGPDAARLATTTESAIQEIGRIEAACSTWRPDSLWSKLNRAEGAVVPLDAEWIRLLGSMKDWSRRTEGAFDPALMPLMEAWDIRGRGRTPTPQELRLVMGSCGAGHLVLDEATGTARFDHASSGLEEGGFLKGYALDRAAAKLIEGGASRWLLDFGGQLLAAGEETVSLAHPVDRQRTRLSLRLVDASLSTSGTSERGRHLLDPRSGRPCAAWGSASAVMPSAADADVVSTALYVMGPAKGLAWAACRHIPACFLFNNGRVRMTREFKALLISKETQ